MSQVLIATGNDGKKQEMLNFFQKLPLRFLSLRDFPPVEEPDETGKDFEENALEKARFYATQFSMPSLGEDSGLILSAFPEKFGLRTKRELNAETDEAWLTQFLELLENETNRKATFYSSIAFYDPHTDMEIVFLGQTSGHITYKAQTSLEKGIPVSSVFIPQGHSEVFSAMSKSQKNKVSHRGKSAFQMENFLLKYFGKNKNINTMENE